MSIKVGSRVKVVKIVRTTDEIIYKKKADYLGTEGIIYGIPHKFHGSKNCGYPEIYDGKTIYSLEYNGKDVSPFAWFAEELELIE